MTHIRYGDHPAELVIRYAVSPSQAIESARQEAERQQYLHETFFGKATETPQEQRKEDESMGCTTQGEKIDSRAVSGGGMGMSEREIRSSDQDAGSLPPDAGSHDHRLQDLIQTARLSDVAIIREHDRQKEIDRGQALRDALSLIMAELPALLEDREKLRKLREVLG